MRTTLADLGCRARVRRITRLYGPGATLRNTDARRIFAPTFGSIYEYCTGGNSNYHALQLSANRRFSHGLTFQMNYAWAKAIDEVSTSEVADSHRQQDPLNCRGDRGLGNFDVRHRFTAASVYDLPFLRGQPALVSTLLGGWQASGIVTLWHSIQRHERRRCSLA